jgi:hypothetical protein
MLAHDTEKGAASVGFGRFGVEGELLVFRGRLDLTSPRGSAALGILRQAGSRLQWSLCFWQLEHDLRALSWYRPGAEGLAEVVTRCWPYEVSPCLKAADSATHTRWYVDASGRRVTLEVPARARALAGVP